MHNSVIFETVLLSTILGVLWYRRVCALVVFSCSLVVSCCGGFVLIIASQLDVRTNKASLSIVFIASLRMNQGVSSGRQLFGDVDGAQRLTVKFVVLTLLQVIFNVCLW